MKKRILRKLYGWFREDFNKFAFHNQFPKPDKFVNCKYQFIDSEGRKYYRFVQDQKIPLTRKAQLEKHLMEFTRKMTENELKKFTGAIKELIQDVINRNDTNVKIQKLAKVGTLIEEMEARQGLLLHDEIMFDLVAVLNIREDENPYEFDQEIHNEKVAQFKEDAKDGLRHFFYGSGLQEYIPYLDMSDEEWRQYLQEMKVKLKSQKEMLRRFTSDKRLSKKKKATESN